MRYKRLVFAPACLRLFLSVLMLLPVSTATAEVQQHTQLDGEAIMQQVLARQVYEPFVYEEQAMILVDRQGKRDVRSLRLFARLATDRRQVLLVFDTPREIQGVALRLFADNSAQSNRYQVYLPALEQPLLTTADEGRASNVLGTDFAIRDLLPEERELFSYQRLDDEIIDEVAHYRVEALPRNVPNNLPAVYSRRLLTIRKDNFVIVRTDYFDHYGRHQKTRSQHELEEYGYGNWQPGMILMENHRENHQTLLKVTRRVFSPDYVPLELFSRDWLLENRHRAATPQMLFELGIRPERVEVESADQAPGKVIGDE
jgi:hypothetical protein